METGRENVKNTSITDDAIKYDKTEYSSNSLAEVIDGENKNDWILVMRYRIAK